MNSLPGGIPGPLGALGPLKKKATISEEIAQLLTQLPEEKQQSVLDFTAYLCDQQPEVDQKEAPKPAPLDIPRPEKEAVIAAIRRLSQTYPMLDRQVLFDATSSAMSAHILSDVSSNDSIDQLEKVFAEAYSLL